MDILIGAADNYGWDEIRPWVKSARLSGFTGEICLILYRVKGDKDKLLEQLAAHQVTIYEANHTPYMTHIEHAQKGSPTQAHSLRFYHAWEVLRAYSVTYDVVDRPYTNVIMTDVRDVIFQTNPSAWLDLHRNRPIIAPSEGIRYGDEPWNKNNLIEGFGIAMWDIEAAQGWVAANVGTIAGEFYVMKDLCNTIFRMTEGRYYPSDQSSFNVLIHGAFNQYTQFVTHARNWACQLGVMGDTTKPDLKKVTCEPHPIINTTTGMVYNHQKEPFVIVHQWDRNADLKPIIQARYA